MTARTAPSTFPDFLQRAAHCFETLPELRQGASKLRQVAESSNQPFNLAVVGRMKVGKSTLMNSLVGRELAVADVEEATATVNWFCHGTGAQTAQFIVHWKDGRTESFPVERLKGEWTGKSAEVKARAEKAARLQLFADLPRLREVQIIDTPGSGAAVEAHERGIKEFLNPDVFKLSAAEGNKADAIVYVVAPVGRESDVENLELFHSGRLTNSGPYNSVCVVHKWDCLDAADPFGEARRKGERLFEQLSGMVAKVIPVSGPIALAARAAPDDFFERLLKVTSSASESDFENALKIERRWKQDPDRAEILDLFPLPWASFTLIARQLRGIRVGDIATAKARCEDYSRIRELEEFIEERFFSQAAIIKKRQILEKTEQVYVPSIKTLELEGNRLADDAENGRKGAKLLHGEPQLSQWMLDKSEDWQRRQESTEAELISLDREWGEHRAELDGLQMDLEISREMDVQPDLFPQHDKHRIRSLCDHLATPQRRSQMGSAQIATLQEIRTMIDFYRSKANRSSRKNQRLFEHVVKRLESACELLTSKLNSLLL